MSAATAIRSLRLHGAAADTPALRLRTAQQLAVADLRPAGLAPSAVLVVRRVADPVPGSVGGGSLRPPADWERAVRDELADAARSAVRPDERGLLPATADAVLFAEEAELLAVLLRELVLGDPPICWWWRAALPALAGSDLSRLLGGDPSPLMISNPQPLPAALVLLVRWRAVSAVAARLGGSIAEQVLSSLIEAHHLPRELASRRPASAITLDFESDRPRLPGTADEASIADAPQRVAPWRSWLPEELVGGRLPAAIEGLFGIAIGVAAAPRLVRTREFADAVIRWWRETADREVSAPPDRRPTVADRLDHVQRGGDPTVIEGSADPFSIEPHDRPVVDPIAETVGHSRRSATGRRTAGRHDIEPSSAPSITDADVDSAGADAARSIDRPPDETATDFGGSEPTAATTPAITWGASEKIRNEEATPAQPPDAERASTDSTSDPPLWSTGERFVTAVGGALYLIHVMKELGLPEIFEENWQLASLAGPWGTLDVLARGLLGRRIEDLADDPLWSMLAALAEWPEEPTTDPEDIPFRLPAGWTDRLGGADPGWCWAAARGRLRLWSQAGYLVADVDRTVAQPSIQARAELRRSRAAASRRGRVATTAELTRAGFAAAPLAALPPLPAGCPIHLGRWLAAVIPAVRRRLRLALGHEDCVIERLLLVPATVWLGSSHLDLVLDMDVADLAVRRAGLDRNPGWLPAFGHVVQFHFS